MKLRLASRRSPDARCAFCHDALQGTVATCPRCLTPFHRDCRGHLSRCPTLGCETTFTVAPEVEVERERPNSLVVELLREGVHLVILCAVACISGFWLVTRERAEWGPALFVFAMASVCLVGSTLRDLQFYLSLFRLFATAPSPMHVETRVEVHHEDRYYVARLIGTDGLMLDVSDPPDWLVSLRPGTTVQVHVGGNGSVGIRTPDGHVYAAPRRRVKRLP